MKKSIKSGIVAAVAVAAGFAAYQSYGSYDLQDNSLLMQNVEALAQAPEGPTSGDPNGEEEKNDNTRVTSEGQEKIKIDCTRKVNGKKEKGKKWDCKRITKPGECILPSSNPCKSSNA